MPACYSLMTRSVCCCCCCCLVRVRVQASSGSALHHGGRPVDEMAAAQPMLGNMSADEIRRRTEEIQVGLCVCVCVCACV